MGEPQLGGGERRISLSSPQSRRSSISFFRFLVFFTGGGAVSGDCTGVVGRGVATMGRGAVEGEARAGAVGAAVAATLYTYLSGYFFFFLNCFFGGAEAPFLCIYSPLPPLR